MIPKSLLIIIISIFFYACSGDGGHRKNLEKLDKVYGYCDNPYRGIEGLEYKVCKDKERAAGPDGVVGDAFDINEMISGIGNRGATVLGSDTNNFLWDASLQVLNSYSLKIIDFEGGFIETNWIMQESIPDERCLIKTHITSYELVSNGVANKIICESKNAGEWFVKNEDYREAEKELTIKILTRAGALSSQSIN
tara:strand:- start:1056 stop:1640 length:585 start_codon:yes stop_codon:yes gene_type:complete